MMYTFFLCTKAQTGDNMEKVFSEYKASIRDMQADDFRINGCKVKVLSGRVCR